MPELKKYILYYLYQVYKDKLYIMTLPKKSVLEFNTILNVFPFTGLSSLKRWVELVSSG